MHIDYKSKGQTWWLHIDGEGRIVSTVATRGALRVLKPREEEGERVIEVSEVQATESESLVRFGTAEMIASALRDRAKAERSWPHPSPMDIEFAVLCEKAADVLMEKRKPFQSTTECKSVDASQVAALDHEMVESIAKIAEKRSEDHARWANASQYPDAQKDQSTKWRNVAEAVRQLSQIKRTEHQSTAAGVETGMAGALEIHNNPDHVMIECPDGTSVRVGREKFSKSETLAEIERRLDLPVVDDADMRENKVLRICRDALRSLGVIGEEE